MDRRRVRQPNAAGTKQQCASSGMNALSVARGADSRAGGREALRATKRGNKKGPVARQQRDEEQEQTET